MPTKQPMTVAASTRTVEELLDEGYRLHEVTSTDHHLVLSFFKGDCGLKVHLGRDEVHGLLGSSLLDQLAASAGTEKRPNAAKITP